MSGKRRQIRVKLSAFQSSHGQDKSGRRSSFLLKIAIRIWRAPWSQHFGGIEEQRSYLLIVWIQCLSSLKYFTLGIKMLISSMTVTEPRVRQHPAQIGSLCRDGIQSQSFWQVLKARRNLGELFRGWAPRSRKKSISMTYKILDLAKSWLESIFIISTIHFSIFPSKIGYYSIFSLRVK